MPKESLTVTPRLEAKAAGLKRYDGKPCNNKKAAKHPIVFAQQMGMLI